MTLPSAGWLWHHELVTSSSRARDAKFTGAEPQLFVQRGVIVEVFLSSTFKNKKRRILIMRLLILAAAATLVVTGAAMARESVRHHHVAHHHSHNVSAPIAEGSAPADTLSAHDAYMQNLHDSGYNSHSDRDSYGNVRQN
jgi:hypothetical protein